MRARFARMSPYALILLVFWPVSSAISTVGTLEDIYGDTGNSFQAAIGFVNFEGTQASQATQSYGLAVDDVVVKWKEFTLVPDLTDCDVSGSCATIELGTPVVYDPQSVLSIKLQEPTPDPVNDCDLDGALDGTSDCSGDGVPDTVVRATSAVETSGEIVFLEQNAGSGSYSGTIPISSLGDGPGVLFVGQQGSGNPVVTVTYLDNDDGTGEPCPNDVDPAKHGIVRSTATVVVGASCEVVVVAAEIEDNGDHDDFVDTNETAEMRLQLLNNCGIDLHQCSARISTNDSKVDCILRSTIDVADLQDSELPVLTDEAFLWKMADVSRSDVAELFVAEFGVTMVCDEIDGLSSPQTVSLTLDMDISDLGQTPAAWVEGFEGGSLGAFETENLDAGIPGQNNVEGLINGDGWRCQYSDPDFPNSAGYGGDEAMSCYPGASLDQSNAVFWHADGPGTGAPDGGRAKSGSFSMYYGSYLAAESDFTTPLAVVESVRTTSPINLGVDSPQLSWWHQISLMDGRTLNTPSSRSADRGVVQLKTVDATGIDTSDWTRLEPFQNTYDTQNTDFYFNCMFDPVDDGNTEDDFFDPTDPNRRLGPSSTCFPEFTYTCLGDTDQPFETGNICNATTEPSADDAGDLGTGTWVKSRVDLTEHKGRRVKLRFLVSAIKGTAETHEDQFDNVNPGPGDDGWWIDDVTVDETLTLPAQIIVDDNVLQHCAGDPAVGCLSLDDCIDAGTTGPCEGEAPQCGPTCVGLTAVVATTPDATGGPLDELLPAPGAAIELDASSSFGTCLDGALQFRFAVEGGLELRPWSENPAYVVVPLQDTDYRVEVRCSTEVSCMGTAVAEIEVDCPSTGDLMTPFPETILAQPDKIGFAWETPLDYDLYSGDLSEVGAYGGLLTSGSGSSFSAAAIPSAGEGYYFLVRESGEFCNDTGLWATGGAGESSAREASLP